MKEVKKLNEIKLFEIPIYSMPYEKYQKRCMAYINRVANTTSPDNYEYFHSWLYNEYYVKRPWKYNQIIGYIVISYKHDSIWFDEYGTHDKRIHAIGNVKHNIVNFLLNGHHFYVSNEMTEEEIKNEIMRWLNIIEKDILNKVWCLDKTLFLEQLKYINLRDMINKV